MNFYAFKNRFKYGYKKFFAILFAILGVACQLTAFILYLVTSIDMLDILALLSYVLVLIAYYYLLSGNIKGTTIAYRGFAIFVFYTLFDFGLFLLQNIMNSFSSFLSGDVVSIVLTIVHLAFSILAFVSGLMTYLKFRSYQMLGRSTTYETVRNWCLVFTIMVVLSYGALIPLYLLGATLAELSFLEAFAPFVMVFIEPLATIFIGISAYFTILRLRD